MDEGAAPLLIDLYNDGIACKSEAVVALQNVSMKAGDEVIIVKDGGIPALVPLLLLPILEVQEAACATRVNVRHIVIFLNVCLGSRLVQVSAMLDHDLRMVKAGALVPLCKMLLGFLNPGVHQRSAAQPRDVRRWCERLCCPCLSLAHSPLSQT